MKNVIKNFWATSYIEYKAIENNKQIIYTQLMIPILYFVFFGFGIGNSFSSLAFKGENVSYIEYIFVGIIGVILNSQMNQSVYRVNLDKKWGLLAYKRIKGTSAISYFFREISISIRNHNSASITNLLFIVLFRNKNTDSSFSKSINYCNY